MALQIKSAPSTPADAEKISAEIRASIEKAIEGAAVEVTAPGPGHFEIQVTSSSFDGETRVVQQQRVYSAIAHFMKGDDAPVHAVDRLRTLLP